MASQFIKMTDGFAIRKSVIKSIQEIEPLLDSKLQHRYKIQYGSGDFISFDSDLTLEQLIELCDS